MVNLIFTGPSSWLRQKLAAVEGKYAAIAEKTGIKADYNRMGVIKQKNILTRGQKNGMIIPQGDRIMRIRSIDSPIEQRNTAKGNPNAILQFNRPLNNRQKKLLDALGAYDSRVTVSKKSVNMKDLSALTAYTGDEFALFTKGSERLVIRGASNHVNIDIAEAKLLSEQGYKWSGHTHPGAGKNCLQASPGDVEILKCFKQNIAYIYNSQGIFLEFEKG